MTSLKASSRSKPTRVVRSEATGLDHLYSKPDNLEGIDAKVATDLSTTIDDVLYGSGANAAWRGNEPTQK